MNVINGTGFDLSKSGNTISGRLPLTMKGGDTTVAFSLAACTSSVKAINRNYIYMTYRGKFSPRNAGKYRGDVSNIVYRSLWERQVFRWLDEQSNIKSWSSEEVVIPYRCSTDGKMHRYFVDVKFELQDGRIFLVEIKPKKETVPPKNPGRKTKRYITEVLTYVKNTSKWEAAKEYAADRGWKFEVWNEDFLKSLGIKIIT